MKIKKPISQLTIEGYKSIRQLEKLQLGDLNVLIGSNGAGKSNFISFFRMLSEMVNSRLQNWVTTQGSADRLLSFGVKETNALDAFVKFGRNGYAFSLEPTDNDELFFAAEKLFLGGPHDGNRWVHFGSGHKESKLDRRHEKSTQGTVADYCYSSISNWKVFHFHDTSSTAGVKRLCAVHDNEYLRQDASNLAAWLYRLAEEHPETLAQIRRTVQLAIPFFDDFVLKPKELPSGEAQIRLLWRQKNSNYALWPSQLSDGSIRFICLVTALLQPDPPSTIIIDEPELGLHPYAITLLGSLLRSASKRMQVIVSTQSVPLVNEFSIDNLIVVERESEQSVFKRYNASDFEHWLDAYSVGELWEKNVLGGRPSK